MKKFKDKNFAYGVAVLLAGAMAFSACSSDEEVVNVNPSFDGESVKTQFAINVAGANKNATRMSAGDTQNNSNYLGMANVRLFTLEGVPGTATALTSDITLAEPTSVSISNSSNIYTDVNIPVGTNNFLFYSTRKDLGTNLSGYQTTGAIESDLFTTSTTAKTALTDITFKGKTIKDVNATTINTVESAFIAYLNGIVTAFGSPAESGTLKSAKDEFIKNFSNKQRAGSAFAILKQVDQLWKIAKGIPADDAADKTLAEAVVTAITGNTTIKIDATGTDLAYASTLSPNYSNFPIAQGLPDGSMLLTYDNNTFKYTNGANAEIGGDNKINMNNITFPLPIVYFDNTPAKASDSELKYWPKNTTDWDAGFTGWDDAVKSSTRAIALENNINYGVASLKTTVKCGAATLEDNAHNYTGTMANQVINVPDGGFTISGLLVGGQPESVGWEMIDGTISGIINRNYVVYDNAVNGAKAKFDVECTPIYTLVFDNWNGGATQENVNVAIELVNNGDKSFYAQDGIVEKGQRFYLIGKLELNDEKKAALTWPTYGTGEGSLKASYQNRYPVKATNADKRIFIQDYTTTANFTISSLKNAYVTIPDLRASKLQLGLSVDLNWISGITFDVEIK